MAVTTSAKPGTHTRRPQSTAKSFSDLEKLMASTSDSSLVSPTATTESTETMTTATETQTPSIEAAAAEKLGQNFDQVINNLKNLGGDNLMLKEIASLFEATVIDMREQGRAMVEDIAQHMQQGLAPLGEQITQNIQETGELRGKLNAAVADIEKLKKATATPTAAAEAKETSKVMKVAGVVKDVGAYTGAAVLVGCAGKVVYDIFFGKSNADE